MARTRTTKKLAQRIDLNYFKRPSPYKRARFWLSVLLPLLALAWMAWRGAAKDSRVYSSGRLSEAHAVLEKECAVCHLRQADTFSAEAADSACLACHDGPAHHASQEKAPACATCHTEHRGRIILAATRDQSCAECHADLRTTAGTPKYATHIRTLEDGHPEFAALHDGGRDPETIKLNHALHMRPIRRGPNGPIVQLECGNCHQSQAAAPDLTYSDPEYRNASISYKPADEILPAGLPAFTPPKPATGRELMAPVKFANACGACHLLTFDKRFDQGVPHDRPEVVHAFLLKTFTEYIGAHPAELREVRDLRDLTGKPLQPAVRTYTASEWIAAHVRDAEELLWRKTCNQCHTLSHTPGRGSRQDDLPVIAEAKITERWMPHAKFDHDAHRGFSCASCHEKALRSTEASDVLLPGIATCQKCHAPGADHAESRCFECHTYHDWSKRKQVTPRFTLPALRTGGL